MSNTSTLDEIEATLEHLQGVEAHTAQCIALAKEVLAALKSERQNDHDPVTPVTPEASKATEAAEVSKGTIFPRRTWGWLRTYFKGIGQSDEQAQASIATLTREDGDALVALRHTQFHQVVGILQQRGSSYDEARAEFARMDVQRAADFIAQSSELPAATDPRSEAAAA